MAAEQLRPARTDLPVEEIIAELQGALAQRGTAVLQAAPGAGKTTLVPLRLLAEPWLMGQRIVVLEPRRVAARAAAGRMAELLGEPVGETVGFVTRDARKVGRTTRIEVVTDGILTRRLQQDPELQRIGLVVFDEFHERHLQADLGLALTLDARSGLRPDLRLLVMSATLDPAPLAALLDGSPVITSRGQNYPVVVRWAAAPSSARLAPRVATAITRALERDTGDVLTFLPGIGEIQAVTSALGSISEVEILPLHGGLSANEQDRVLRPGTSRRVVLSTDLAETSVTVEGVGVVIDAGLVRRPAYEPATGLTRLRTGLASRAAADQRAGRAGRTGAGIAYRLWTESSHLARSAWPAPEIANVDLAALVLELAVWGAPPAALRWLDAPPPAALAIARQLLEALGALDGDRPTAIGRRLVELPLHPRLARMLLSASELDRRRAALLAALLSERDIITRSERDALGTADVATRLAILERDEGPPSSAVDRSAVATVRRRADELLRRVTRASSSDGATRNASASSSPESASAPGPLLAEAYPDRIAQSRGGGRYRLRFGGGAVLAEHDPLRTADWLVVADVEAPARALGRADGEIRLAGTLERADVEQRAAGLIRTVTEVEWDEQLGDARATTKRVLDDLVLDVVRGPAPPGPSTAAALLDYAVRSGLAPLGWTPATRALQARARWARDTIDGDWPDISDNALAESSDVWLAPRLRSARGRADLARVDPAVAISAVLGGRRGELDRLAPPSVELSTGRRIAVDYRDGQPRAAVRVQELFGTKTHPMVDDGHIPVVVELLSPAGRPIQITADLPRFWTGSWKDVRREMASRYPKHSWPEDPTTTTPTNRPPRTPRGR